MHRCSLRAKGKEVRYLIFSVEKHTDKSATIKSKPTINSRIYARKIFFGPEPFQQLQGQASETKCIVEFAYRSKKHTIAARKERKMDR
jgi:hypothetical protein